jgi:hypothetical protein
MYYLFLFLAKTFVGTYGVNDAIEAVRKIHLTLLRITNPV